MIYMPRILFFHWKYFKCMKRGIFTCESQKSFSVMRNLESHLGGKLLTKNSIVTSHIRYCTVFSTKSNEEEKKVNFKTAVMLNKFSKTKLELLKDKSVYFDEESLLILFKKMCVIYHSNKLDSKFIINLPLFVESEEFKTFCTLLEKHLPKIMPDDLGILLNFELFKIPIKSTLMRKIFTLILDNINNISFVNILEIYIQLNSNYFKNSTECENIRKACEVYFANTLEDEVSHSRRFEELIYFLNEKDLPINVKKIIAERILEVLNYESFTAVLLQKFFRFVFEPSLLPLLKDRIMDAFKNCIIINIATSSQKKLIGEYENVNSRTETVYDEEICEIFAENAMNSRHHLSHCGLVMEKLCLIGYFNEKLLHYTVDSIFGANFSNMLPSTVLQTASFLARTCYHEMNYPSWEKVKDVLQLYKPDESEYFGDLNKLIQWTEYLTFLECDTRHLLDSIFVFANDENYLKTKNLDCQNILHLHHLAQAYFSDGYTKLKKKKLEFYLQNTTFSEKIYSLSHVYEFFGGEDYVLKNCTNSHKHFIQVDYLELINDEGSQETLIRIISVFSVHSALAIVLGPDNKPLNLSSCKPALVLNKTNRTSKEIFKVFFNIENIIKPPGSRVVAFMIYHDNQPFKFRNVPITSGAARIFQKSVRNLGCDLIPLSRRYLYLKNEEKEKYLQSQIDDIIKKSESEKSGNICESVSKDQ